MARLDICDRCSKPIDKNKKLPRLFAKRRGWKFMTITPLKGAFGDLGPIQAGHIELCQNCTRDFFKLLIPKVEKPKVTRVRVKMADKPKATKKGATNAKTKAKR